VRALVPLLPKLIKIRQARYLNNIVEQDHRFIKRRVVLMCSSCASAAIFEMQHALPGASTANTRLHPPGSGMEALYQTRVI
jgi:transposase-like protein